MEAFPWSSGLEKKIQDPGHLKINPPPIFFRGLKVTGRPPSRSDFFFSVEKGVVFPSKWCPDRNFDLLMEKKRWFGKPATSSSRGGLRKNADSKIHSQEETGFRCLFLVFHAKPWNTGRPFRTQVKPGCRFCTEMHWNLPARFCSKIVAFF